MTNKTYHLNRLDEGFQMSSSKLKSDYLIKGYEHLTSAFLTYKFIIVALMLHCYPHSVVVMLCGGNIDTTVLGRSLDRGLAADGRLVRFVVRLPDRAGSLCQLTQLLMNIKASVKDIEHERTWLEGSIYDVEVRTTDS